MEARVKVNNVEVNDVDEVNLEVNNVGRPAD